VTKKNVHNIIWLFESIKGRKHLATNTLQIHALLRELNPSLKRLCPFARAMCLHPPTTPPQVPTCSHNHIKQKTRITNNKSKSTSDAIECNSRVQLQTPNYPTFTLHKITPKILSKSFQACSTNLHDFSKYVSKLKTNLCNHLTCVFQQNQRTHAYL
jgi:hypothetical protein